VARVISYFFTLCPFLSELRKIWYPNGYKIVPKNLKLTLKTLAWFYMGDGSSSDKKGHSVKKYDITLATQGFKKEDTITIIQKLHDLGFIGAYPMKRKLTLPAKGRGFAIILSRTKQVAEFMKMVEPFMIRPTFSYKIKHPLIFTPEIIAKRDRKRPYIGTEDTILAITAYKNYENTDMTRNQIYDEIAKELGFTKKERKRLGGKLHSYLMKNPDEKNRKNLKEKIIESFKRYEKSKMPSSEIYDRMQIELKIPTKNRRSMRNTICDYKRIS